MADLDILVREADAKLREAGRPERAEYAEGYMPSETVFYGVSVPDTRRIAKDLARELRELPGDEVIELARRLVATNVFEARHLAYELLARHREAFAALGAREVEQLGHGMDNWASVDAFTSLVAGPAWAAGQLEDAQIERWARSDDRWWRRAALASTVTLNRKRRGEEGDAARTLPICELLVDDRDDMVVKAMSWALRSLAARDPASARAFLETHEARLAARVVREVRRKLETGYKNPPRRSGATRAISKRGAR